MPTNGKRNRTAGHAWERASVTKLKDTKAFPHVVTSRSESKARDDAKVDLMNKDELINGRLSYNIQCKNTTTSLPYPKLLAEMPNDGYINVLFHNQTKKVGGRFMSKGQYAMLSLEDFIRLITQVEELKDIVNTYFDNHTIEEQKEINTKLKQMGL